MSVEKWMQWICLLLLILNRQVYSQAPREVTAVIGTTAMLPCTVDFIGSQQVIWKDPRSTMLTINEQRLSNDFRYSIIRPYIREWNLQIEHVRKTDQGIYLCIINSTPAKNYEISLNVWFPPTLHTHPAALLSRGLAQNVTLTCNATGFPQPEISWFKYSDTGEKIELSRGPTSYYINDVTADDGGTYECEADNDVSPSDRRTTKLDVHFPPAILLPYQKISQSLGKDTLLECIITANPLDIHYWTKDGMRLEDDAKYRIHLWDVGSNTKTLGLHIGSLEQADYGDYSCQAQNDHGQAQDKLTLLDELLQVAHTNEKPNTDDKDNVTTAASYQSNYNDTSQEYEVTDSPTSMNMEANTSIATSTPYKKILTEHYVKTTIPPFTTPVWTECDTQPGGTPIPLPPSTPSTFTHTAAPTTTKNPNRPPDICTSKFDAIMEAHDHNVYIFKGRWIWRLDGGFHGLNRTSPTLARKVYDRPPTNNIAAAVHSTHTKFTYLFKGDKIWKYYGFQRVLKKSMSTITGYPKNVNAAVTDAEGRIYLLQGSRYYIFDEDPLGVSTVSHNITERWPGIAEDVESAVRLRNGFFYFFKGHKYRKFDDLFHRVLPGYPKHTHPVWFGPQCGGKHGQI